MQYNIDFKHDLNEKQYEAVSTTFQYVRVVAGAGSGKTRVLTYRIAYLISECNVKPWNILAITFTNKVASEMKNRVVNLVPSSEKDLTIKTFHSFCAMFLRHEIDSIGFTNSFTILDEEDQALMIKDIAGEMGYKRNDQIIKKAVSYISKNKNKGNKPEDIKIEFEKFEGEKDCLEIYSRYEDRKDSMFCLDFDDLLLKTISILELFPLIRSRWQSKISHILVDEFQDTNDVEYHLLKLLINTETSLYVVGDPDQTIYTWRGANQHIILDLEKDFKGAKTIILNRNYRSTQNILNSANKLISYNKLRVKKDLYTENAIGNEIITKVSPTIDSEADYVAREIMRLHEIEHIDYKDIVLLYRSSYVTMQFEGALMAKRIPYVIYGGIKFYQRAEIKDVLSFFRLIVNQKDDVAFLRIINVPKRGIGESSQSLLRQEASLLNKSLYEYVYEINQYDSNLPSRVIDSLSSLIQILDITRTNIKKDEEVFSKVLEDMLTSIGYYEYLLKEDEGDERVDNVKALFADLRHYLKENPDASFDEYLQNISLLSSQDEMVDTDKVNLMTVHTAKGLEFPVVFIVRFNDCVFPHSKSMNEEGFKGLEEERRLAYVAMTRAREKLYITCANGYNYVAGGELIPSQFYKESGNAVSKYGCDESYNPYGNNKSKSSYNTSLFSDCNNMSFEKDVEPIHQDFSEPNNGIDNWAIGDIVIHKKLGRGVVIALEGDDIISVRFDEHGVKSILGNHPSVSKGSK